MKKSERLNQELIFLSDKSSFHLKDIMNAFDISKRTALRDIKELETMGLGIYVENGRYGGYKLVTQNLLTPVYFSNDEILAIFFALKALDILSSTPFEKSYTQIKEKLFATLPSNKKQDISKVLNYIYYYNVAPINKSPFLSDILMSIMNEYVVSITYTQHQNITTHIQIYDLFYRNGIWFCSAYDINNEQWGTYRCDYITALKFKNHEVTPYSRRALEQFQTHFEDTYHNISFRCQLTSLGVELYQKKNYPNMQLAYIDDVPYITGGYNKEELAYMVQYLISLGEHVKIIYPEQLKNSYINKLKSILNAYK